MLFQIRIRLFLVILNTNTIISTYFEYEYVFMRYPGLNPQMMDLQQGVQPAVQIHCLSVAAAALGEKRVAGAELTSCGRPMRPVCQPTELFGEHRDSAQVLSTPLQRQFSGYEACDLAELAYFGGALLGDRSLWVTAAYPLITQIECRVRTWTREPLRAGCPGPCCEAMLCTETQFAHAL